MGLIAVNIIGLIMFILAIVMFVLADSMVGIAIGVAISVVWLTFTITANVHILKGRRSTEKLKDSARGHLFDAQIERLNRQYESIMSREEYFQENVEEASQLCETYGIVAKAAVAAAAIPDCNLCCVTGGDIQSAIEPYYNVLFEANPDSIGGALPGEDFYFVAS